MKSFIFSVALVVLTFVGAVAYPVDQPHETSAAQATTSAMPVSSNGAGEWRRTAQGWELSSAWEVGPTSNRPYQREWEAWGAIHPALLATFMLLISLLALLATEPTSKPGVSRQIG